MARIASAAGGTGRTIGTATAVMTHQHRYHHPLREGLATILADVSLLQLATMRIVRRLDGFDIGPLHGQSPAFLASFEFIELLSLFFYHHLMAVRATIGPETKCLNLAFHSMHLWHGKSRIMLHRRFTFGTQTIIALVHFFLQNRVINPT